MEITPEMQQILQDQFLGKRIQVWTKESGTIVGVCTFIGNNKYLSGFGLQVTIDRLPIRNVELKNIILL